MFLSQIIDRYKMQGVQELSIKEAKNVFDVIFEHIKDYCSNLDINWPDYEEAFMHWIGLKDMEV